MRLSRFLITLACCGGTFSQAVADGWVKVPIEERMVAGLPKTPRVQGALPRQVMIAQLHERGEVFDDPDETSYWVFDPGQPKKGLRLIFRGPGQEQYAWLRTDLHNGYAVTEGQLNKNKEPDGKKSWFWFNVLDGTIGQTIKVDTWEQYRHNGWIVGQQSVKENGNKDILRINSYHPLKGIVRTPQIKFSYLNWLDKNKVLGVTRIKGSDRVVIFDVEKSKYRTIGTPPPGFAGNANRYFRYDIHPAGPGCRDGLYAIDAFKLWYMLKNGKWRTVIKDVNVVKTFGGVAPWLPVSYVGNGHFCVSKTVKNEIPIPTNWKEDRKMFGAAEGVTMLIDGKTGKILKQSEPFAYDHNPKLVIAKDWWTGGIKPEPSFWDKRFAEREKSGKPLFKTDREKREIRFLSEPAKGKVIKYREDDNFSESNDGRYIAVFGQLPRVRKQEKSVVLFRIFDGTTGEERILKIESNFKDVYCEFQWKWLRAQ